MQQERQSNTLFAEIVGQLSAINFLQAALDKQRIAPAYLFAGPEGVGRKLTTLRFLEGLINEGSPNKAIRRQLETRNHPDLLWVEPTYIHQGNLITKSVAINENMHRRSLPQIRLEQIKEIKRFLSKKPIKANVSMIVIEDIETMNESASNALLKTIEEPQIGIFILISRRPEVTLKTILSRCQKINFKRLNLESIQKVFANRDDSIQTNLSSLLNEKELISLANGSPGAIIKQMEIWHSIPIELWPRIKEISILSPIDSLSLAKDLTEQLDTEQQIWIISWIQQYLWIEQTQFKAIKRLENLRLQIQSFINPRLAWEITLLNISNA
tara:strand:+ start:916 stop:1896 length:981 start_codon:yes stop_codon:yes gene_type:complete